MKALHTDRYAGRTVTFGTIPVPFDENGYSGPVPDAVLERAQALPGMTVFEWPEYAAPTEDAGMSEVAAQAAPCTCDHSQGDYCTNCPDEEAVENLVDAGENIPGPYQAAEEFAEAEKVGVEVEAGVESTYDLGNPAPAAPPVRKPRPKPKPKAKPLTKRPAAPQE